MGVKTGLDATWKNIKEEAVEIEAEPKPNVTLDDIPENKPDVVISRKYVQQGVDEVKGKLLPRECESSEVA